MQEELKRLGDLAGELKAGIDRLAGAPSITPPAEPVRNPRPLVKIGRARVQRGLDAIVQVALEALMPIAGFWLNIRHAPKLEFLKARCPLPQAKLVRSEGVRDHSRHLVSFTTDAESESAEPGGGLVQVAPGAVILEITYRVNILVDPGVYPIAGGKSGIAEPGAARLSWPTLLLDWGRGGVEPEVEDGEVQVTL